MTHIRTITDMDREYLVGMVTDGATTGAGVAVGGMISGGGIVRGVEMIGITGMVGASMGGTGTMATALGWGGARVLTALAG